MNFPELLNWAKGLTAERLPQALPELFAKVYEAGLLDTEQEALFQVLRKATGVSKGALLKDWARYRTTREAKAREETPELSQEALKAARELSQDRGLLHLALRTMRELGVVGEEENLGLLYLALLSAKTEGPVSVLVKGRSSAGKSHLVKTALKLIPPRGYYELTAMSAKALIYAELDFSHRHLVIYEEDGLANEEVLYLTRTLLSEGEIRYLTTEKAPNGRLQAREIHRPGPTGLITTLTQGLSKEDNETRTLSLYVDDSKGQTLRVVEALALREALGAEPAFDPAPWHALYHTLPQAPVQVPFAPQLARLLQAEDLPEDLTRLRRDFPRFLTLVKVLALLHHARREEREGRIVAGLEDYALAYHLAARPMARSVHTIAPQALHLAQAVKQLLLAKRDAGEDQVTVKELARHLRWSKRTVHKWKELAEEGGLITVIKDGGADRIGLAPGARLEESAFALLPEPEELARELGEELAYTHPITGERVHFSPVHACTPGVEEGEKAVLDGESERARPVHERARRARPQGEVELEVIEEW